VLFERWPLGLHGRHGTVLRLLTLRLLWLRARLRLRLLRSNWPRLRSIFTTPWRYGLKRTWLILRLALFRTRRRLGSRLRDGLPRRRPVLRGPLLLRRWLEGPLLIRLRSLLKRLRLRLRGQSRPSRFRARLWRHSTRRQYCRMSRDLIRTRRGSMILGLQRLRRDDLRRAPTVYACELRAIRFELPRLLDLRLHRREPLLTQYGHFLGHWSQRHSAGAAVIAHAIRRDACGAVIVDVAKHRGIHVRDVAVVDEITALPIAAVEASADIAVAIVDSAIETDVRSPIASMPHIPA
jgi:hypothetical protein